MSKECGNCGTDEADYLKDFLEDPDAEEFEIRECPFCGVEKCSRCDMGDDIPCENCDDDFAE